MGWWWCLCMRLWAQLSICGLARAPISLHPHSIPPMSMYLWKGGRIGQVAFIILHNQEVWYGPIPALETLPSGRCPLEGNPLRLAGRRIDKTASCGMSQARTSMVLSFEELWTASTGVCWRPLRSQPQPRPLRVLLD